LAAEITCKVSGGGASNMSVMFVGAIVALNRSSDGPRRFVIFAAVGDLGVEPGGGGAARHPGFLLREIEMGFI
jgi:hypothetical protein